MPDSAHRPSTAFAGSSILASGPLIDVALAVKAADAPHVLVLDDATGRVVDLDLRGDRAEIEARLITPPAPRAGRYRPKATVPPPEPAKPKGRGRPKLGVTAKEVTLLPRHWDWLATQRGGASATLRRLVDEARKSTPDEAGRDAAYGAMQALAGDEHGYEEALRALFAGDLAGLETHAADWPADIRTYVLRLAQGITGDDQ